MFVVWVAAELLPGCVDVNLRRHRCCGVLGMGKSCDG